MKTTVGTMIRNAREGLGLTRKEAARKLKISAGYLALLETDSAVRLSDGLIIRLHQKLSVPLAIVLLQDKHNARTRRVRRTYPSTG